MIGNWGAWGEDEDAMATPKPQQVDAVALISNLSPLITAIVDPLTDPVRRVEVLRAKLINAKSSGASTEKIRLLEAKLRAAEHAVGIRVAGEERTRTWAGLGQLGILTGIGVGGALIFFIMLKALK